MEREGTVPQYLLSNGPARHNLHRQTGRLKDGPVSLAQAIGQQPSTGLVIVLVGGVGDASHVGQYLPHRLTC